MKYEEKFTFFWGGPFSNFYTSYFTDNQGITYSCSEQFFMSKKASFFGDDYHYKKIMESNNPKEHKKLGRSVKNFDAELWYGGDNPAKKFMYEANYYKYTQNEKLKKILLDTRGTTLVEASPYDKIWGIGMRYCIMANYRKYWEGKNWLGEVLTKVRDFIIMEEERFKLF